MAFFVGFKKKFTDREKKIMKWICLKCDNILGSSYSNYICVLVFHFHGSRRKNVEKGISLCLFFGVKVMFVVKVCKLF